MIRRLDIKLLIFLLLICSYVQARKVSKSKLPDEICMTECIGGSCQIGRNNTDIADCYQTEEEATIYFTSGLNQKKDGRCVGECAEAGFEYNWCFTSFGDWDKCSREYGKAASGANCQTPCQYNDETFYSCTTAFNETENYDEPCSPVTINEPSPLHQVATLKNVKNQGTCMSPCNKNCYYGWAASEFDDCKPTNKLIFQYYTSKNAQKKVVLCSGECNSAGYPYNWCYTVNQVKWDYCSRVDGLTYNNVKCLSECRIQESAYFTCQTKEKYEICSPKPIDLGKAFEINQKLLDASENSDSKSFSLLFEQVKAVFHKTIVDDTANGGANVIYYHDYVDGVQIVRGLEANVSRELILKRNVSEQDDSEYGSSIRLPYQAQKDDKLGLFLDMMIGGSDTALINFVPLEINSSYQSIQTKILKKVETDEDVKSIDIKVFPVYTFNGHRPLGFVCIVAYETYHGHFDISFSIVQDNIIKKYGDIKHEHDEESTSDDTVHSLLRTIVMVIGAIAFSFIGYSFYMKKTTK